MLYEVITDQDNLAVAGLDAIHEAGPPGQTPLGGVSAAGLDFPLHIGRRQHDQLVGGRNNFV